MSNPPPVSPVAAARAAHLRHGINLSHWYAQVYHKVGYIPKHFDSYNTDADLALIKSMGFDHVRFTIAPEPMFNPADPAQLPADYIARLDRVTQTLLDLDLAVIVDLHPEQAFKRQLADDDARVEAFARFWEALAGHFATFDPERVFFEVLNEPETRDPKRWNAIQNQAAAAIRRAAPAHTIIVSGDEWSQLPMFELLEPPPDRNVICNFHLYDPNTFSHQGAKWAQPYAMFCKGMTYPADPAFIENFLKTVTDPEAIEQIKEYRDLNWNAARYEKLISRAADWGRAHGHPLTCNEFGVYKVFAPRASRLAWIKDVSGLLEKYNIGWTMWDYAGDFEVVNNIDGKRVPDAGVLAALGLAGATAGK